jgi:hypothetical protein
MCQLKHHLYISKSYVLIEASPFHLQKMCQSKHIFFISKRYVSIETPFFHLQEVYSHLKLKQYEAAHILCHFNIFLFENLVFQTFYV